MDAGITHTFKGAVEQLVSAHVQETNELRKIIKANEENYTQEREKWQKEKTTLTAEIEKLKKDKQDLRGMQKKAQVLLDKYRSQLRSQLQDLQEDEDENKNEQLEDKVTPPKSKQSPILPPQDCYVIISDDHAHFQTNKDNLPKKEKDGKSPKLEAEKKDKGDKAEKQKDDKQTKEKKRDDKGSNVQPIDLSLDEPNSTPKSKQNNKNNDTGKMSIRKSSEHKTKITTNGADLLDDIDATIQGKNIKRNSFTTDDINTNVTPKPTKTKYNKYNLTPKVRDTPATDNKTPKQNTQSNNNNNNNNNITPTAKPKSNSTNTSPVNSDTDSDLYQKAYDQFRANSKRLVDDLDFTSDASPPSSSSKPTPNMPPPPAPGSKKFKYSEVVRNKDERAALPAHECDQCQKFYEALGDGYDRSKMVNNCSRHRARDAIPDTPPDYWQMSFPSSETQDN